MSLESIKDLFRIRTEQRDFYRMHIDDNGNTVLNDEEVKVLGRAGFYRELAWNLEPGDPIRLKALEKLFALKSDEKYRAAETSDVESYAKFEDAAPTLIKPEMILSKADKNKKRV
jgi:hypothetical protein